VDPLSDNASYQDLQLRAISLKETLSKRGSAKLVCNHAGNALTVEITREQFEELTRDLVGKCRVLCDIVLTEAGLEWSGIDTVLLVGGSTRMPMIPKMVQEVTGKTPSMELNPDECVADGAAWQGLLLAAAQGTAQNGAQKWIPSGLEIQKVTSFNLGTDALRDGTELRNFLMIPKFTPVPCEITKKFYTVTTNQRLVQITVMEGGEMGPDETCAVEDAIKIGEGAIMDIPSSPQGSPIEVTFQYDEDGMLNVMAKHIPSGQSCSVRVERPGSLSTAQREAAVRNMAKMSVSS
jgi:molecular chaperone DnaK